MFYIPFPFTSDMVSPHYCCHIDVCSSNFFFSRIQLQLIHVSFYSLVDWFFFMVLDIGNPAIESIPLGIRFVAGLLQGIAVRAAGFGIVPIALLAPAVKYVSLIASLTSILTRM